MIRQPPRSPLLPYTTLFRSSTWLGLALNGLGFGLLVSPVTATALSWGGLPRAALSAASVNLSRVVGMMVCLSLITALRSEEHTSELQSQSNLVCRLLLAKNE